MDYEQIALAFHLLGFALGLGGATISDVTFFNSIRGKTLSAEKYTFLNTLSKVIWTGLILLIVSGGIIFWLIYAEQGRIPMLSSPRWQTKLTLVGIVLLNGFYFMLSVFPALKSITGKKLSLEIMRPLLNKLAISGTISILSWYGIFVVTLLPRTFRPPYLYFIGTYLILLIIGVLTSRAVMRRLLK